MFIFDQHKITCSNANKEYVDSRLLRRKAYYVAKIDTSFKKSHPSALKDDKKDLVFYNFLRDRSHKSLAASWSMN